MNVILKSGAYKTEDLNTKVQENAIVIEDCARNKPLEVNKSPIGYVIPLGTLGNAVDKPAQFKSNFHIVAYTIADQLLDKALDFEDFNITESSQGQGSILKMIRSLDEYAEKNLGKGWHITLFNTKIKVVIDSMCKGSSDMDALKKAVDDFYSIATSRVEGLKRSTREKQWPHDMVELFYTPLKALNLKFKKNIDEKNTANSDACNSLIIESLVYDTYANGFRLLHNSESFASSKVRQHGADGTTMLYVLKARIVGDPVTFRPVRQFAGKSRVSNFAGISGCSERIIYNLVNKNYKHWSFMSIPDALVINLEELD